MSKTQPLFNDGNVVAQTIPIDPSSANEAYTMSRSDVFHRSLRQDPLRVVSAKGHYLKLSNGQQILDATGGAAVSSLGHGNEQVRNAMIDQMETISYCHSLFYSTDAAEDLANFLIDSTKGEMSRVFFISSGSEAIEASLKLARQFHLEKTPSEPQRTHFIARQQSYHGITLGALAVGGHVARRSIYEPILHVNSSRVSPCYIYRDDAGVETDSKTSIESYVQRLEDELDAEFQRLGPSKVAAFIAEPVVGAALGCVPSVPGYFQAVRRVCDRYGALLIFDEIMCGAGRVGPRPTARYPTPLHAWQDPLVGVVPDIMAMGKALGGGYMPVAAMLAGRKVVKALQNGTGAFSHGQTYQGHPLACRAALEVQRIIKCEDLVANVRMQGALLEKLLQEELGAHDAVGDIRGKGLFWGIEFVAHKQTKEPFKAEEAIAMGIHELGMCEPYNISLYPGTGCVNGTRGDHIILAPAFTVTEADIRNIVAITAAVVRAYFAKRATR